jgi:hypothetical protein
MVVALGEAALDLVRSVVIGQKLSTVEGRLYRAREKLRAELNA